jgi:2-keto-4-pentenoate hydratase/2-oxohepta-3-ene-1,7-dioic acid hydratase in catechol pathway
MGDFPIIFMKTPTTVIGPEQTIVLPRHLRSDKVDYEGDLVQEGNTGDMAFSVPEIISFLSGSNTLLPGTLILTGTPDGVGTARTPPRFLKKGDEIAITIENIGTLKNTVVEEVL